MEKDQDQDKTAPAEPEAGTSGSPGSGGTIPKSKDGVWITSAPGGSNFEPEEDAPAGDSGAESAGGSEKEA
jgi:hypothetical protein